MSEATATTPRFDTLASVTPLSTAEVARARRAPRLRSGAAAARPARPPPRSGDEVPLVLVVAPAGYGKTTLLAHWVRRRAAAGAAGSASTRPTTTRAGWSA